MALPISQGSGATVATDLIGGAHYGYNKIVDGTASSTNAWVVDSSGSGQVALKGNVTISDSKGFIGLVTVGNNVAVGSNIAWSDPKTFVGLTTSVIGSAATIFAVVNTNPISEPSVVLDTGSNFIGIVTVANTVTETIQGNVTLDKGSLTGIIGNVTISDSRGYIGLVTATLGGGNATITPMGQFLNLASLISIASGGFGPLVVDNWGRQVLGNAQGYIGLVSVSQAAWSDPKTFIGLTTAVNGQAWPDPKSFIGLTTAVNGQAWPDPKTYIGLVTVANTVPVTFSGNVTLDAGSKTAIVGNVTLSDPKTFIGLVTLGGGAAWTDPKTYIGLVTVTQASTARTITGNMTLSDAKTNIGLVTLTGGTAWTDPKTYIGLVTVGHTVTVAAHGIAGNVTLDAGSKTGIVGNVTISDSKGFIGLVTIGGGLGYSYSFISMASITVVKSGAGYLKAIVIGMPSLPSTLIYDQTSAASPVIGALAIGVAPGTYRYDLTFATGLTIKHATTAVLPQVTVIYK